MSASRLCLIVAFVLLLIAGLLSSDIFKGGPSAIGVALVGFAFWALAGAV